MVKLVFLGKLSDLKRNTDAEIAALARAESVADLRLCLAEIYPAIEDWSAVHIKIALDGKLVDEAARLAGVSEIALMPPVGGG